MGIYWHDTRATVKAVDDYFYDLSDLIQELRNLEDGQVNRILNEFQAKTYQDDVQGVKVSILGR